MNSSSSDIRVLRTKTAIKNAFKQMIVDMEYHEITVKALAIRAGINRKTFYLHYVSLDDLFVELQNEIVQDLVDSVQRVKAENELTIEHILKCYNDLIMKDLDLHRRLMFTESYQFLCTNVNDVLMTKWASNIVPQNGKRDEFRIVYEFICNGIVAAYKSWFELEQPIPSESLIKILARQIESGISHLEIICI